MKERVVLACALALAGCGSTATTTVTVTSTGPRSSPSPSPQVSSSTVRELLIGVVESHNGNDPHVTDTVAIVGLDGYARNRATFAPLTPPAIGNAAPILQPSARVVGGRLFFIDGRGTVAWLGPEKSSTPQRLASVPMPSPQGYVSFAVSPDGHSVIASVDTLTAHQTPNPNDVSGNPFGSGGDQVSDAIVEADDGGGARTLAVDSHPGAGDSILTVGGWDATGPVGLVGAPLGTQSEYPDGWYAAAVRIDGGRRGAPLGGGQCPTAVEELTDGTLLCSTLSGAGAATTHVADVVGGGGQRLWSVTAAAPPPNQSLAGSIGLHLAPDAAHCTVAYAGALPTTSVVDRGGHASVLAAGFVAQGWIDADTVVGRITKDAPGNLAVVRLSSPGHVVDLGFKGDYVGVVERP